VQTRWLNPLLIRAPSRSRLAEDAHHELMAIGALSAWSGNDRRPHDMTTAVRIARALASLGYAADEVATMEPRGSRAPPSEDAGTRQHRARRDDLAGCRACANCSMVSGVKRAGSDYCRALLAVGRAIER